MASPLQNPLATASEFRRYEFKYWVEPRVKQRFLDYLLNFMSLDAHDPAGAGYQVTSLYLDNPAIQTYREKVDGDIERRKYRIRYYNGDHRKLFLEIKEKRNFFVRKLRRMERLEADEPISQDLLSLSGEGDCSFAFAVKAQNLRPFCWVSYQRIALVGKHNQDLRVTFDTNLCGTLATGFSLGHMELRPLLLSQWRRQVIMEIKFDHYLPTWMDVGIRELGLTPQSISKYGMGVNRFHFNEWAENRWIH